MDQGSSSKNIFDFNSQAGVMSLLASIRTSDLSPADKNELRDLVFLYTNGGGDVSVRIALEQKLVNHNIVPVTPKAAPVEAAPVLSFGSSRPSPVFNAAPTVKTVPVTPAPTPVIPTPAPTPVPPAPVAPTPAPVIPSAPQSAPVQVPTPAPQAPVTPPPVAPAPAVPPTPQPAPAPVAPAPQPAPAPAISANNSSYLDRIREIKAAVNSKVGNPVNLVDINNEVGREYMNALLDAMKRLSGGAPGQIESAMARLETSYKAVEVAVAAHSPVKPTAATTSTSTSTPAPQAPVTPAPVAPAPVVPPTPQPAPAPVAPTPTPTPAQEPETPKPAATNSYSIPSSAPVAKPVVKSGDLKIDNYDDFKYEEIKNGPSGFDAQPQAESAPAVATQAPSASVQANSLAAEKKPLTPTDLPSSPSLANSNEIDPLLTKAVDDGLDQLLTDWTLFKKSGLFGTGPKGREHPLFIKLAPLQIPLLLTGRFEGSTQEIKQSITDYMNGWRYEQGIIYEQGETFEHYLRRVINQILELQNKRRKA